MRLIATSKTPVAWGEEETEAPTMLKSTVRTIVAMGYSEQHAETDGGTREASRWPR